jgi:hypothetical protein
METAITAFDLKIRYQIYRFIAERCRVPTDQEIASLLNVAKDEVRSSFHRLHARHMIFLEPGGDTIRMANPFSAVPTRYKVRSEKKQWWANCAWDAFGIAAALHTDVDIEAAYPDSEERVNLQVNHGVVDGKNQVVYFSLPCSQWYDDLVFT